MNRLISIKTITTIFLFLISIPAYSTEEVYCGRYKSVKSKCNGIRNLYNKRKYFAYFDDLMNLIKINKSNNQINK